MAHNFIADFRKGGDFLKSYWEKWSREQVAFFHDQTIKGTESNIFTCKPRSWQLFLDHKIKSYSHTRATKAGNSKAFTWKRRDNTTHSEGLITWAGLAISCRGDFYPGSTCEGPAQSRHFYIEVGSNEHENCVTRGPVTRLVYSPGRPASVITWEISARDPDITILGSQLPELARLSYNRKVNFCCV